MQSPHLKIGELWSIFLREECLNELFGIIPYGTFVSSPLFVSFFIPSRIYIRMASWIFKNILNYNSK